jgi:hypothetical protein
MGVECFSILIIIRLNYLIIYLAYLLMRENSLMISFVVRYSYFLAVFFSPFFIFTVIYANYYSPGVFRILDLVI